MPIYDINCRDCGRSSEVLAMDTRAAPSCPHCGGNRTDKLMSATSSLTGKESEKYPGPRDTACCGTSPSQAGCEGPGSCCGRTR